MHAEIIELRDYREYQTPMPDLIRVQLVTAPSSLKDPVTGVLPRIPVRVYWALTQIEPGRDLGNPLFANTQIPGGYRWWMDEVASGIHGAALAEALADDNVVDAEEWPIGAMIPIQFPLPTSRRVNTYLARKNRHWYSGATGRRFNKKTPAIELRRPKRMDEILALIAAHEAQETALKVVSRLAGWAA